MATCARLSSILSFRVHVKLYYRIVSYRRCVWWLSVSWSYVIHWRHWLKHSTTSKSLREDNQLIEDWTCWHWSWLNAKYSCTRLWQWITDAPALATLNTTRCCRRRKYRTVSWQISIVAYDETDKTAMFISHFFRRSNCLLHNSVVLSCHLMPCRFYFLTLKYCRPKF